MENNYKSDFNDDTYMDETEYECRNNLFVCALRKGINDSIGFEIDHVRDYIVDNPEPACPNFTGIFDNKNLFPVYVLATIMFLITLSTYVNTNTRPTDPSQKTFSPDSSSIAETSLNSWNPTNRRYSTINTSYGNRTYADSVINSPVKMNFPFGTRNSQPGLASASYQDSIPDERQIMPSKNMLASLNFMN
jgi:hypothetical protein